MIRKKTIGRLLAIVFVVSTVLVSFLALSGCRREPRFDAFRVGSTTMPNNLNPYDDAGAASTFVTSHIYQTMLDTISVADEEFLPAGADRFNELDDTNNPFRFADGLVYAAGAYPMQEGSTMGRVDNFTPTTLQRNTLLARRGLNPNVNTAEEMIEAVPLDGWFKYTFRVVEGHSWNDGTPFTAYDIQFTLDYIIANRGAIGPQAAFLINYSHSVVRENGTYIDIILGTHIASDIRAIANAIVIIPRHIWQYIDNPRAFANTTNPVGTGRFVLEQFVIGNSVTLRLRDDIDRTHISDDFPRYISLIFYGNMDVMISALNNGSLDMILDGIDSSRAHQIRNNPNIHGNVRLASTSTDFVTTLCFNVARFYDNRWGTFNDGGVLRGRGHALRQAVSLAINQQQLIDSVHFGTGMRVGSGLVKNDQPHAILTGEYAYHRFDIVEANRILDAAGFTRQGNFRRAPDGTELNIRILAMPASERLVTAIREMIEENIGVQFSFVQAGADFSSVTQHQQNAIADFDVIINSVNLNFANLLMFHARFAPYRNTTWPRRWNQSGLVDEELNRLINIMEQERNPAMQIEPARAVQRHIAGVFAEIPLFSPNVLTAYSTLNFRGFVPVHGTGNLLTAYTIRHLERVS